MPFPRSTLQELIDRIKTDFESNIEGATSLLRRSFLNVFSKVLGGAFFLLDGFLDFAVNQLFITTSDEAGIYNHGDEYGIERKSGSKATGSAVATGTQGTEITAGLELSSDTAHRYSITETTYIDIIGNAIINFEAVEIGVSYNDDPGITLTFVRPPENVDREVTVDSVGIINGTDIEDIEDYRERVLARKQNPPHGGADFDYVAWAKEVDGVTRAWAFDLYMGPGTVALAFVRDGDENIFPDEAERDIVYNYLLEHEDPITKEPTGIPVTAKYGFFVLELNPLTVDLTIQLYPNTVAVQNQVRQNLEQFLSENSAPQITLALSNFSEAISLTEGEEKHRIISPTTDISTTATQLHILGTVTFEDYV